MPNQMIQRKIETLPPKSFFIKTLVKDIDLLDAILDLIDNSIDSYISKKHFDRKSIFVKQLNGSFVIEDNCGGIKKESVYEHVFRFGDMAESIGKSIGAYGIGLKRAIFKMGTHILIESDDGEEYYSVEIDKQWINDDKNWDLDFKEEGKTKGSPITRITIKNMYDNIADQINLTVFWNKLKDRIRDTYSIFIKESIDIYVNEEKIEPYQFKFLNNTTSFKPLYKKSVYDDVEVEIYAGYTDIEQSNLTNGWYVFCNKRLILGNDKSVRTGWGGSERAYHYPEDERFLGLVFFSSDKPYLLPWQTTKTDIDYDSKLYRHVQIDMQAITYRFQSVLRWAWRVKDADTGETVGKSLFENIPLIALTEITLEQEGIIPKIKEGGHYITVTSISEYTSIQYSKKKKIVNAAKKKLGNPYMSNKEMGEKIFDYFANIQEIEE